MREFAYKFFRLIILTAVASILFNLFMEWVANPW